MTDWISPEVFLFLLKGALLMILGLLLPGVMRRSSATFRHAMMASWFGALLLLPVASGLLPRWNLPVPGWLAGAEETSSVVPAGMSERTSDATGKTTRAEAVVLPEESSPSAAGQWIFWLWLDGAGLLLSRLLLGNCLLRRRTASAAGLPAPLDQWAEQARQELNVSQPVRFGRDEKADMPLVWGVRRPVILLPRACTSWKKETFKMILLHELSHIRRRDLWTQKMALISRAVYWFLPPVWWAARWLLKEGEKACDELVLSQGGMPRSYARELLRFARTATQAGTPEGGVGFFSSSNLEDRVRAVLRGPARRPIRPRWGLTGALSLALMLPLAALAPGSARSSVPGGASRQTSTAQEATRDGSLSWRTDGRHFRLRMRGVRISPDYRTLESITEGGYFRFWEETGRERRIEVDPGVEEELIFRYWVGGEEQSDAAGRDFLEEALERLEDIDLARTSLDETLEKLNGELREDLEESLESVRRTLSGLDFGLSLEGLTDHLEDLKLLYSGRSRLDLEEVRDRLRDLRSLRSEHMSERMLELKERLGDLSLDLTLDLQPHLDEMRIRLGDLRLELDGVREEMLRRKDAFTDGLVDVLRDEAQGFRQTLSTDEGERLDRNLSSEAQRLIRDVGLDVEDREWRLDRGASQRRRFERRLREVLGRYQAEPPAELAGQMAERAWAFSLRFDD